MKRYLGILIVMLAIMCVSDVVCATSTTETTEETIEDDTSDNYDSNGCIYAKESETGHIRQGYINVGGHNGSYWNAFVQNMICEEGTYMYCTYWINGSDTFYYLNFVGNGEVTSKRTGVHRGHLESADTPINDSELVKGCVATVGPSYGPCDYEHPAHYFSTNIPLFNSADEDAINKYIDSGDYSGADNADEVLPPEYDEGVELPSGLKFSGQFNFSAFNGNNTFMAWSYTSAGDIFDDVSAPDLLSLSWNLPDDLECTYDIEIRATFNMSNAGQQSTNWVNIAEKESYGGDYTVFDIMSLSQDVNYLRDKIDPIIDTWDIDSCACVSARIRNRKGNKCSNWVVITMLGNGSASARVEDDSGNSVENDEYDGSTNYDTNGEDGKPVNPSDNDSDCDSGGIDFGEISVDSLMSYIKNGFGLLGSNGIIALMSNTYTYLPQSFWTIILFFVSMLVVISIIKVVKEVLF